MKAFYILNSLDFLLLLFEKNFSKIFIQLRINRKSRNHNNHCGVHGYYEFCPNKAVVITDVLGNVSGKTIRPKLVKRNEQRFVSILAFSIRNVVLYVNAKSHARKKPLLEG